MFLTLSVENLYPKPRKPEANRGQIGQENRRPTNKSTGNVDWRFQAALVG